MIIRSQDKKSIVNFANIEDVKLNEIQISISNDFWYFDICHYNSNGNEELLGTYSTEEKAIKVLDMIQSAYLQECLVIQLPQDSEV